MAATVLNIVIKMLFVMKIYLYITGLSLKKTVHVYLPHAKATFIAMACNSKSHNIILWHVISKKMSIGKKIIGLETMA